MVDSQGRVFGRVNLLDLMALFLLMSMGGTLTYAVAVSRFHLLEVFSIEPRRVVAGSGTSVMMKGTGFDPQTTVRLGDYPDQGGVYFDESTIGMEITEKFHPDLYRVIVHDGRGRYVTAPGAVEVVWIPRTSEVRPHIIYSAGPGARLQILGEFFTDPCSVRVGERELEVTAVTGHRQLEAELGEGAAPLPLGEQAVTVVNKGNHAATLEGAVRVYPPPEVISLEPSTLLAGQSTEVVLHGRHLEEGTRVWFGKHLVGEAQFVNPERLKLQLASHPEISRQDLYLELPGGPKVLVMERALEVQGRVPLLMVVDIFVDEESMASLESLQRLPAWQQRRPLKGLRLRRPIHHYFSRTLPIVEVVLPVDMEKVAGEGYRYYYRGKGGGLLRVGTRITLNVNGHRISGTVAAEPFAVFGDDLLT